VPRFELTTRVLLRELASGDAVAVLAADPKLASYGDEEEALLAVRMFLAEHLAQAPAAEVARFALPEAARLHFTDVLVPRPDLPRRCAVETELRVTSVILPTVTDARGRVHAWVVVVPLGHTFFVPEGEDLDEAVAAEVNRLASARALSPAGYRELLPWPEERLVPVTVTVARGADGPDGRIALTRKAAAEHEVRKQAIAVLESIAEPVHAALRAPRPFPLRDRELAALGALLGGEERASVLLLGPERVGKTGLLMAYLEREADARRARYVFRTSGARLVAGMSGFGQWQERVRRVMDAAHMLDAVLWFDDLADLFADRPTASVDLPSAMRPWLDDGKVRVVGELRDDALDGVEAKNAGFVACFARVRLEPMRSREAASILAELARDDARREPDRPSLGPEAVAAVVELADRFFPYESFPGKAVGLARDLRAAREMALGSEAPGARITAADVAAWFSLRTGVPPFLLHDDRALRVEETTAKLRARLVGQDDAVRRVAQLVSVIKAGLGPAGKPLATLLFVGPTGVGKTELARALAELLYGSEARLVRFDMSEFSDPTAGARLFLGGDSGLGLLTRRVREQPFGVVLLDEIEKAHFSVFDVLLQVTGEGRLTDGRGKTTSFENTIVIMTSNLGATHRAAPAGFDRGASVDDEHYAKVVRQTFRPELVNRIDRIVAFSPLTDREHVEVVRIAARRAERRRGIAARGIQLVVDEAALGQLARAGRSDAYGARALRRHVERALVTPVARLVSARGDGIDGEIVRVAPEGAPTERGEEPGVTADGLRFGVVRAPERRSARAAEALSYVMSVRRETHRQRRLDRVTQVSDRIDTLVAELGYGDDRKKKKDRRPGAELAELQGEHHRLATLRDALDLALADIFAAEELALTGFLEGETLEGLRAGVDAARAKFRAALARTLVAEEPDRDAATLMVVELDGLRAMDLWLAPLLGDLDRRRWQAHLHVDGGERTPSWPADRRWGPPQTPASVLHRLAAEERPLRSLLVSIEGDHAGVLLALEAGLHRFTGFRPVADPAHLHVALVARRTAITSEEWAPPRLDPPSPATYEALAKRRPVREHDARAEAVAVPGGARVRVPAGEYWIRVEDVALEHLLHLEQRPAAERDAQLRPLLAGDELAGVRSELRKGNLIAAIKVYRDARGVSLAEAKRAVEAMR
jgi:ATP-dependent Clp protease ATP-binding subunit ClpC